MEKKLHNQKRCLACKHYSRNCCPMMADASTSKIDKCILEYNDVKNIRPCSIEEFIFYNHPLIFLQWCGKGKSLEVGDKVITLRGGFGTCYSGKFLTVTKSDEYHYFFTDGNNDYALLKDEWYMSVFKLTT